MKKSTAKWIHKAEHDRVIAIQSSESKIPLHDGVCFHSQQCTEKYLKALLEELGQTVPKTHDLEKLLELLLPDHPSLRAHSRGMGYLTPFAVVTRYPDENATRRQAKSALRWMERIRTEVRRLLDI